jgi:hypothetical protein
MTVYVDDCRIPWGKYVMSHLLGSDLDELHAFAESIGLRRYWFQDKRIPHYDVSETKRQKALQKGAVAIACSELPDDVYRQEVTL